MSDPLTLAVSVVMPVYNGSAFLRRAVESLRHQTFADWELLAADDGSADGSADLLDGLAAADPRVRVFRHPINRGQAAARNTALAHARGHLVAYLDQDDEFYPDHLARAWDWRDKGDVLVFRYDQVDELAGSPTFGRVTEYNPAARYRAMFAETIAVPLGVIHRRDLLDTVGTFDEALGKHRGQDEDGDLWRRFARAGARFTFVPAKCGLYHVRSDSFARTRPPAPADRARPAVETVEVRYGADRYRLRVHAGDGWLARQVFERGEYAGVPVGRLNAPPVVLDVGANAGAFALYARLAFHRDAVVHCFEPHPATVELLRANLARFPGVTVHPVALGRADGEAELLLDPGSSAGNSLKPGLVPRPAGRVRVAVRAAGAVWDELGLDEVDVLKVDAEGCEVDVLESLGGRLGRVRVVLAEFHTPADRRRIDALLPGHELFGTTLHSVNVGVVKYVRADLVRTSASPPPAVRPPSVIDPGPAAPSAPVLAPVPLYVVSARPHAERRVLARRWLADLDPARFRAVFVVGGDGPAPEPDVLVVPCADDYKALPAKTRAICQHFLRSHPHAPILVKCDDDTYLHAEALTAALPGLTASEYAGFGWRLPDVRFASGACYIVGRRLAGWCATELPDRGSEDVEVGRVARRHGVPLTHTPTVHHLGLIRSRPALAVHYVRTAAGEAFTRAALAGRDLGPVVAVSGRHPRWGHDSLLLYPAWGRLVRSATGDWADYSVTGETATVRWDRFPSESFLVRDDRWEVLPAATSAATAPGAGFVGATGTGLGSRPTAGAAGHRQRPTGRPRVLFASYHCFRDPASGAALSTRDLFDALTARGWACGAVTGPNLDDRRSVPIGDRLSGGEGGRVDRGRMGSLTYATHSSAPAGYPVTVFVPDPPAARRPPTPEEARAFADLLDRVVRQFRPDVVLTYGGDPASRAAIPAARSVGAKVVLWLHNLAYQGAEFFRQYDAVVVPSAFARSHYRDAFGVDGVVLPPVLDPERTAVGHSPDSRRYATFVNPEPAKGVSWFARIAEALGRARPDVPLLVVEGRGRVDWVGRCGVDLSATRSVHRMKNTDDPRQFYRVSRVMLMPSLVGETFGRVAAEAMLNGTPVLASDRGALPETVGAGGVLLPIPDRFTPATREPPTADEVAPWVAAVVRMWDDPSWYEQLSTEAVRSAQRWRPEVVLPRWEEFLGKIIAVR